jgi:serine/threonine protein kinase
VLPKEKMDSACGTLSYVAPEVTTGRSAFLLSYPLLTRPCPSMYSVYCRC